MAEITPGVDAMTSTTGCAGGRRRWPAWPSSPTGRSSVRVIGVGLFADEMLRDA